MCVISTQIITLSSNCVTLLNAQNILKTTKISLASKHRRTKTQLKFSRFWQHCQFSSDLCYVNDTQVIDLL